MYADGWSTSAPFDPWQLGWSFAVGFLGETKHPEDDIPGTAAYPMYYTAMGIQSADTGALRAVPCYLGIHQGLSNYHANADTYDHAWIWTDPLS